MNWLEEEIELNERRVKKITENPAPHKLACNRKLYELELSLRKAQLEAWREEKSCLVAGISTIEPLLRSMGLQPLDLQGAADKVKVADEYMDIIKAAGFPDNHCDRTVAYIGMCIKGYLPLPKLVVTSNVGCDSLYLGFNALARHLNIPVFCLDVPLEENEDTIKYMAAQLEELIVFIKKNVPGAKYDEDKLVWFHQANRQAIECLREIYAMRKRVPCPVPVEDTFRLPRLPAAYPDVEYCLGFWRDFSKEIREMAERADIPKERLRVMWTCAAPYFANPFQVLERRNVSIPIFQIDMVARLMAGKRAVYGDIEYGRKFTPLEEEARMQYLSGWVGLGQKWLDDVIYVARDLSIDAIVNFMQVGCMATSGLARLVADTAERELDIPVLNVEGRQLLRESYDKEKFEGELEEFIDICLIRKGRSIGVTHGL